MRSIEKVYQIFYLDGPTGTPFHTLVYNGYGQSRKRIPDINGDHIDDFVTNWHGSMNAYSGADGQHIWHENELGDAVAVWGDEDQDGNPEIICNGDGTSLLIVEILPGMLTDSLELSASSNIPIEFSVNFAAARAFKPYAILASDVSGLTLINQFEIPLGWSRLLAYTMGTAPLPGATNFHGSLDANGDANAWLTPAPRLDRFVGSSVHLSALVFEYVGAIPVGERCSQVIQIEIVP